MHNNTVRPALAPGSYFGHTAGRREIAGLILTESAYAPDTYIPTHCHENAFFYLVVQGACQETSQGRECVAEPSTLILHPQQAPHANHWIGTAGRCFHVEFDAGWRQRLCDQGLRLDGPAEHHSGLPVWFATRLYREFLQTDAASPFAIEGLTLELLAEFVRAPEASASSRPPRWLEEAREFLHAHFAEGLDVETIAQVVDIHPAHLVRAFRRQYRCTMGDYVRNLRIEFACRQLSLGRVSLADIALAAGFSDQSHFCKTFKRIIGLTPTQYQAPFRLGKPHTNE